MHYQDYPYNMHTDSLYNSSPPRDPPYATFPTPHHTFSPHNHTNSILSSHPVLCRYTYKVVHYRYLQMHLRKDNNGSFLPPSRMNLLPRDCSPDDPANNNDTFCHSKKHNRSQSEATWQHHFHRPHCLNNQ